MYFRTFLEHRDLSSQDDLYGGRRDTAGGCSADVLQNFDVFQISLPFLGPSAGLRDRWLKLY